MATALLVSYLLYANTLGSKNQWTWLCLYKFQHRAMSQDPHKSLLDLAMFQFLIFFLMKPENM